MALSWCKVASNLDSHPKIRRAGRCGREVFLFALRRNAEPDNVEPGYLPAVMLEPWYLADLLMMSETDAVTGVTGAVTAGLLARDGDRFAIVGWEEDWGKGGNSGADRTRRWRENKQMRADVTGVTSPNVTGDARDGCDALEEKREEEKRLEEKRVLEAAALAALKSKADKAARLPSSKPFPSDWEPRDAEISTATQAGLSCMAEVAAFRDHHTAKGSRFTDWNAAFRTWLRNAVKFSGAKPGQPAKAVGRSEPLPMEAYLADEGRSF